VNSLDLAIGSGFLLVSGLGTLSAYHMSKMIIGNYDHTNKKLEDINGALNASLREVGEQLSAARDALTSSNIELAGARRDIGFLKRKMSNLGVYPNDRTGRKRVRRSRKRANV